MRWYLVGLGNPEQQYATTRHNAGWLWLDHLVENFNLPTPEMKKHYLGRVSEGLISDQTVTILYPDTRMNNSGRAVVKLISPEALPQLIVAYDDIDLPLGLVKISTGRGSGGHNGLQSVIDALGNNNFIRLRIGIAPRRFFGGQVYRPGGEDLPKYVLQSFTKKELTKLTDVYHQLDEILINIMIDGVTATMNKFN